MLKITMHNNVHAVPPNAIKKMNAKFYGKKN